MITFEPIHEFNKVFQLRELTVGETIQISIIPKEHEEKRLTTMLNFILDKAHDPLLLTVQERYFLLLKYLQKQNNTLFDSDARSHIDSFIKSHESRSTWNMEQEYGTRTVKQLIGKEAEFIEQNFPTIHEKLIALLAFQYKDKASEHECLREFVDLEQNDGDYLLAVKNRFQKLLRIPNSEHQKIYNEFHELNCFLNTHLSPMVTPSGIVLNKINGGTDDAPTRFCASDSFPQSIADID